MPHIWVTSPTGINQWLHCYIHVIGNFTTSPSHALSFSLYSLFIRVKLPVRTSNPKLCIEVVLIAWGTYNHDTTKFPFNLKLKITREGIREYRISAINTAATI